jgi:uncharacterized membrane protein
VKFDWKVALKMWAFAFFGLVLTALGVMVVRWLDARYGEFVSFLFVATVGGLGLAIAAGVIAGGVNDAGE